MNLIITLSYETAQWSSYLDHDILSLGSYSFGGVAFLCGEARLVRVTMD
jgi:hypothetical protein